MNSGKTIFAQLMDFLPTYEFRSCVERYQNNYNSRASPVEINFYEWLSRN